VGRRGEAEAQRAAQRAARFGLPPKSETTLGGAGGANGKGKAKGAAAAALTAAAALSKADQAKLTARASRFAPVGTTSSGGAVEVPKRERPKGGIKVLSGVEGAFMKAGKRPVEASGGALAKRQETA